MTKPLSGVSIHIEDDGHCFVQAASRSDEGHLWAIERRELSVPTLLEVAELLGPDFLEGVRSRLRFNRELLESQLRRAQQAAASVPILEAAIEAIDRSVSESRPEGKIGP